MTQLRSPKLTTKIPYVVKDSWINPNIYITKNLISGKIEFTIIPHHKITVTV